MGKKTKYTIQCSECGEKWSVVAEKMPRMCIMCGAADDPDFVPERLNIGGSAIARSVDQTYRQYEEASAAAAEATGNPTMKVTNMKDNLREGDVAAIVPQPSKDYRDQVAAIAGGDYSPWQGGFGGVSTQAALAGVKSGQDRGTGAPVMQAIQKTMFPQSPIRSVQGLSPSWGGS